jgi:acetyltransferase-like isoleucine patch superfamily enzyme
MKKIAKYFFKICLFIYWTVRNLLEDKKIYDYTIRPSSKIGKKVMIRSGNEIGNIEIGDYSYISGPRSYIEDAIIGKYCSIARQVTIGVSGHNYNWVTTSPIITSTKYGFINKDIPEPQKGIPVIGNDVWVGMNAIIMRGVRIGDGAVIAAGSIVTSDVLPYSIVAGVPAKHLKFRFEEEEITMLLEMRWWDWTNEKIKARINDFYSVDSLIKNYSQQE